MSTRETQENLAHTATDLPSGKERTSANLYLRRLFYTLIVILIAVFVVGATTIHNLRTSGLNQNKEPENNLADVTHDISDQTAESTDKPEDATNDTTKDRPAPLDFQPVIDSWAKKTEGKKSVYIYDLDLNQIAGAYESHNIYNIASLYKLFVTYEGYRRIASETWDKEAKVDKTDKTFIECLDLAIRESDSTCAENIWELIGRDNLDEIIEDDFKINSSDISSLLSNPTDIAAMMKIFYEHREIKDEALIRKMEDSFLNQPATEYDWRQGLPSGFSDRVKVYDKVGWEYDENKERWNLYHDAAIIKFQLADKSTRDFIVVIMTEGVSFTEVRTLGTNLEQAFYAQT